jgi:hypothetical protein
MAGLTVQQMMTGNVSGTGPIPTQTFYSSNIAGTTVPKVGAAQATNSIASTGSSLGVSNMSIALVLVLLIGLGFVLHYVHFEESISERGRIV